ncbi:hypothetical protein PYW08_002543 [Mythimna loreyi]|uniref:Uncharacterized protein n=1 Tax=Mythimna loreyi TaxID=667449 RepID=A0ACC2QM81_9NEOP|nr:hypothetical protein PYW08_002543 [Mythimna loreyi]
MGDVQVCRICLNMDVKMQDLSVYPLVSYFAVFVIESKPLYPSLPQYACYECAALVKKFYLFREKCLRSQGLLCRIIDDCGQLTQPAIKSIPRKNFLTVTNVTNISIDQESATDCIDIETPQFVVEVIKKEDHDDIDIPDHVSPDNSSSDDDDECAKKDDKKIPEVEKVEISLKMDLEEESDGAEFPVTTVDKPKLPIKKSKTTQPKSKRVRQKRTRTAVAKKSPVSKVKKDDTECEEMTDDLINVITLSLEDQLEEMNKRKQSSNYLDCPYKCHQCYRGFNNTHAWKHHLTKHSPSLGDIECKICKYRFKTKRNLQRHALNHGKRYVCNLCPYNSSNITTVKQHQGSHKGITHKCKYCDEVFNVRTTYVSHMRIKHPSENICGFCGYSFYSKQGLVVHKNMMHKDVETNQEGNTEEGPYCEQCDVKFMSTEAYKRHMVMSVKHTRTTHSMNGCRVCGEIFTDPEELRLHNREEHPKKQPKHYNYQRKSQVRTKWPAKCQHCPEEFATPRSYWSHYRLKHPDKYEPVRKNCVCDICGKRYACNAVLELHKRTHLGERPYKCAQCERACFSAHDLRVHQQKHSDARPFCCALCQQAFKRKEALERHLKIHSGDNPYKCEICGVAFAKSCTRTLHVRTVHTKEPPPPRKRRNKVNK